MKSILEKKNKKAQGFSVIMFFVIVLSLFIMGVLIMSLVNTVLEPFRESISMVSNESAETVEDIQNKFTGIWDWIIVFLFLFNVVILLLSSFLVDIHPVFLIIYIISLFFLFMFGSTIHGALEDVYDPYGVFGSGNVTAGGNALGEMPIVSWLLTNFTMVILGIAILSGVVMYAKFKFLGGGGTRY